jgi:hypothetical protein
VVAVCAPVAIAVLAGTTALVAIAVLADTS